MWDKEYLIVLIGCYQSNIEHHPITQMIFFYIEFCGYSGQGYVAPEKNILIIFCTAS